MKKAILILLAAAACVQAQKSESVTRFYQLKYADAVNLASLLQPYSRHINTNGQLRALTIEANKDSIPEIEELIRRLDVP